MEFQEAVARLIQNQNAGKGNGGEKQKKSKGNGNGNGNGGEKHKKWKISIHRPSISKSKLKKEAQKEFLCPLSGSLMNDPVIVSSGHSFEKACVQACTAIGFVPLLENGSRPDFSTVIPNTALKSTIVNWCKDQRIDLPKPLDLFSAKELVRTKMEAQNQILDRRNSTDHSLRPGPGRPVSNLCDLSILGLSNFYISDDSVGSVVSTMPLQLRTRPCCYSSASSSELEMQNPNLSAEEEFITKMKSLHLFEVEEALISLRKITRTKEDTRLQLCSPRLLAALTPLTISRYTNIQVNSVACLVNLSLEKLNKTKIVHSGSLPFLIDVLKSGNAEAQEHAAGAIFSLALNYNNKTAIGALGALPPLLHLLRSERERTRNDSALALYHLSLVGSNRAKLIKLGSVPILLLMAKSGHMRSLVLLILRNMASYSDGQAAIMDSGGLECVVGILRDSEWESESTRDSCVSILYGLSYRGSRFKCLAKAVGMGEVLLQVDQKGSKLSKVRAKRMLEMMKENVEVEEEEEEEEEEVVVDWEELLGLESTSGKTLDESSRPSFDV